MVDELGGAANPITFSRMMTRGRHCRAKSMMPLKTVPVRTRRTASLEASALGFRKLTPWHGKPA